MQAFALVVDSGVFWILLVLFYGAKSFTSFYYGVSNSNHPWTFDSLRVSVFSTSFLVPLLLCSSLMHWDTPFSFTYLRQLLSNVFSMKLQCHFQFTLKTNQVHFSGDVSILIQEVPVRFQSLVWNCYPISSVVASFQLCVRYPELPFLCARQLWLIQFTYMTFIHILDSSLFL